MIAPAAFAKLRLHQFIPGEIEPLAGWELKKGGLSFVEIGLAGLGLES